jgi:DNA-binding transcriptional LysR family regulator
MLEIDLLRCFVAVVDCGGFTHAGSRIGLSQSAVSQRISRLEERIGARLFVRTTRAFELSAEGEILLGYARRIADLHEEALERLKAPRMKGTLRVGFVDYFGPDVLPETIRRFSRTYPDVHLEMHAGMGMDLRPLYDNGQLDLLISGDDGSGTGRLVARDALVWACGQDYAAALPCAGAERIPLVALPQPCVFRITAMEALDALQAGWEVVFTGTGMASVLAALRAGLGISVLPASAVAPGLKVLDAEAGFPALPDFATYVYSSGGVAEELKELFIACLEQQFAPLCRL